MIALVVTAFVPIPGHPRSAEEYHRLAEPFRELSYEVPVLASEMDLEDCWLHQYLREEDVPANELTHSVADNPEKNSLAYHIVQAQKTEFLAMAAQECDDRPDVYVWIDYGIFRLPGVTRQVIKDFVLRISEEQVIAIPGCWGPDYVYDDQKPCWRFCGGVMVVPRAYVHNFDTAMKVECIDWISKHHNVSWEVNTLARVERNWKLPIWWYGPCDHDASMFTNYRQTEHADGRSSTSLAPGDEGHHWAV